MKIQDLLLKDAMIMDLQATTKEAAIDEMIARYHQVGVVDDVNNYRDAILKREAESTTGIGDGIAMPHAKVSSVKKAAVLFAKSDQGVDYNALDGQPVHLFFMIAAPEGANNEHLQALSALSSLLINPDLVAALKKAKTPDEVQQLFSDAQAKKDVEEQAREAKEAAEAAPKAKEQATNNDRPYIVAVTACPTGIAHTYMAEAALIDEAKKMDVDIKVETNGSEGVKHLLTADEIKRAAGVIVAADKKVEMARFNGKPLLNRPVIDGIKKPHELIETVIEGKAPTYTTDETATNKDDGNTKSAGSQLYGQLMNGISNMLPFVVAGGIVMALSFLIERFVGDQSMWYTFPNQIGNAAFSFLIPVLSAYIAEAIGDRPALMPGFVGGYMASQATMSVLPSKSPAGFLGGLVAGFLAGYIVILMKKVFKNLPKTFDGLKPIFIYPILGLLIVGALMYFIIDPVFGMINHAITAFLNNMGTSNAVVLGALLAGMMAIDMGGPFNKAAYVFAIGAFETTQNGALMAAVMVGGMVPPLAIAIATTFWPKKWTTQERNSGLSNYLLGISFITEGAIPFAAADPLHIITSSVIGAAIGGGLTQLMHVNVPAPHGGLFVIFLANNPFGYLISVVVGAVIAGVILGLWKKPLATTEDTTITNN
ncbi:fructose-specific phosphotransferase system, enzyme IIABC [Lapidilactobacillus dextrinicus DSM 20335]|uniref:Fructose-specific phosphotransferase system, enzyme IIABC n=1 Tax=Lapidilactobacillus dextrinicus DSM 20335 TaxID=1423738 RepID=A0A0R2BJW9_9LACO|nr:fructose-specific PTS transporter subunit EIIC [Lapidilactobacillus dextrinicus]KRM79157.1 fructose-specific phosphotransferase system, enzyme IIABC [Lapidilactobacillus dextrinicus DSM 20335]QFG46997.1 PTS fructose transporter subunit IIC [Lapidilactobacillus dextrinicus]